MIDSHCHLYELDESEWVNSGLEAMICVGADVETSLRSIELANKYPEVYATVGMHPEGIFNFQFSIYKQLLNLSKSKKTVAIGECGLDTGSDEEIELFKFSISYMQLD